MNAQDEGFTQGVIYSIAELIRRGAVDYAEELWIQSGFKESDLSICDSYDANKVRELLKKRSK